MKELVVISGKGGTGKTSIVASFAALAQKAVLADCDVDAADLHLVLAPNILQRSQFSGGSQARIMAGHCTACGKCEEVCRFNAIYYDGSGNGRVEKTFRVDPIACEGCGVCAWFCHEKAIDFSPAINGEWFVSDTRYGPMVHARLGVAEENSGKLVSLVRMEAKKIAVKRKRELLIIDGSPGIGCPVIASITGADMVLVVTEPTLSGLHDLNRVAQLTMHFGIQTLVCVNKWDLNTELTAKIENEARLAGVQAVGRIRYDRAVTDAQIKGQAMVEYTTSGAAEDLNELWSRVSDKLGELNPLTIL
ncbi:MAG: ATP-binding protein [Pirellulales bacterium]|nr:ATP-binding protein [Pirellulales bacterium]